MAAKGAYTHLLTGTLKTFVTEQMEKSPESQNEIQEELALLRANASRAVEFYDKALQANNVAHIMVAAEAMKRELAAVTTTAAIAAKIQNSSSEQITLGAMENIVGAIIDLVHETLRDEKNGLQLAARLERLIGERINLRLDRGTVLLPSDTLVTSMDNSVPMLESNNSPSEENNSVLETD